MMLYATTAARSPATIRRTRGRRRRRTRSLATASASTPESPPRPKRIVISTGDVSGDTHGAALVRELERRSLGDVSIAAIGGPRLAATGVAMLGTDDDDDSGSGDTSTISSIGLWEALPFIGAALRIQRRAKEQMARLQPDAVRERGRERERTSIQIRFCGGRDGERAQIVLIDYPGINIPLATWAKTRLQPTPRVIYYIPPNEW